MPAIGLRLAAMPAATARPSADAAAALIAGCGLAWLVGVALHLQLAELPPSTLLQAGIAAAAASMLGGAALAFAGARRAQIAAAAHRAAALLALLACGLFGWAGPALVAEQRMAERLPHALEAVDLLVTGVVADLPDAGPNGLRFAFDVESASLAGGAVRIPPRLLVGWYLGREEDASLSPLQRSLRAGQRWRLPLRLRRPHGNLNPHGFDHELFLFERGIGATAHVRDTVERPRLLADGVGRRIARLRQTVRDDIFERVDDRRAAGVLAALAVGDQGAIERDDWQLFRDTGIAHLVAISGLHITMFSWLAGGLIGAAWRRCPPAMRWIAAPTAGRWGGLAAAAAYAVIAGWGVPAQRTLTMLGLVVLLGSLGRRWPWPMIMLTAAVLVTVLDPWALLQPGFWLSFVAVGLLLATSADAAAAPPQPRRSARQWLAAAARLGAGQSWQLLRHQFVITVGLAPLCIIFFQQVSMVGLLANLVAIPLVTLLVTPLALLGVALPWLWHPAAALLQGLGGLLGELASWPLAVATVAAAPQWARLAAIVGAVLATLPLPWRLRLLALPLLIPLLLPPRPLPAAGQFELLALDVGQGTAVLIRTRSQLLLFDTGPQYSRDSDAGQRILQPLLRGRGERRVDRLILSHRDSDHVGGAASLLRTTAVDDVLASLEDGHPLARLGTTVRRCIAGQAWQWDGVQFEILHPLAADYDGNRKPNAMSCVLRVAGGAAGASVLVTGDIERQQELELLSRGPSRLRSSVLVAPHHGSRTSSTEDFIDAVAPRVVIFQAGYRNRFGHPSPDIVDRYRRRGIQTVESSRCGAWWWRGGDPVAALCERVRVRRYWHDRPPPGDR